MSFDKPVFRPSSEPCAQFKQIADQIAMFGAHFKVPITPYWDEDLIHFQRLNGKKQQQVLKTISEQRDFFQIAVSEGIHPNDPKLIWRTLAKMGLTPLSDIFDKITEEDTVEVYHWDNSTSFKNLKFFEFISMSLEEIYSLPWMDQMQLNPRMFLFFLEVSAKLKLAGYDQTFAPKMSHYYINEKCGEKRRFYIHLKWISPVTQNGEKKAALFINRSQFA